MAAEITPPDGNAQHALWMQKIETRLQRLEIANRLTNASFAGRLRCLDENGNDRVIVGQLDAGEYGIAVLDGDGNTQFQVDDSGMRQPYLPIHTHDASGGGGRLVGGGGSWWDTEWWMRAERISHGGLTVHIVGYTEAGVSGEVRIQTADGSEMTAAATYNASGGFTGHTFRWLHGLPIGTSPAEFRVYARKTAGAGNFWVYDPNGAGLSDPDDCTASGL